MLMTAPISLLAAFAAAFVLGSIPTALWLGRALRGIDLRQHGSGNLGATNVYRVLGPRWGITALLADAGKGVAAVLVARTLGASATDPVWHAILGLFGALLGHMFTPFAGWRGGKGVATAAGAWGALAPLPLGLALVAWSLIFAATRIVSLASVIAGLVLPIVLLISRASPLTDPLVWFGVITGALILLRHRPNLQRLARGEEKPLTLRRASAGKGAR